MDQKEIEDFKESVKRLTESLDQLSGATDQSDKNFKDAFGKKFPNAARASIEGISGLGNAASDAAAAIYRGERGMKVMAKGVDQLADAVQTAVGILTFFTPWGKALKLSTKLLLNGGAAIAKGMSSFQKLTAEQSDKLFDVYQNLSKIGAVGAGGLEDLNDSLMRAGFTIAELDQFANVIKKNAKDLTYFGASAQDGAKNLVEISGAITKSNLGYSLQMLGYSAAEIADATATNIVLQTRLGRVQNKTITELALEGAKFALELDKMARFTGTSREEQEQARKSLIEDERYAAFLGGEARDRNLNIDAVENLIGTFADPEMRKGLQHLLAGGGAATTTEAQKVMRTDPQAYSRLMAVAENRLSTIDAARQFGGALGQYRETFQGLTRYTGTGPGVSMGGQGGALMYSERVKSIEAAAAKRGITPEEFIANEQEMAKLNQGALKDQVELRRKQMDIGQTLDTTVHNFRELNKVTGTLVNQFDKLIQKGPTPAGGRPVSSGAPTVGATGGVATSSGLTGKSLSGLDQDFADRFSQAANEYYKATGKKPNVTSGFRTYEEQAKLYQDYLAGKSPYPTAPPGKSQHEIGRSVDIDRASADAMDAMGILKKYGLSRPVAGDPIHIQGATGFRGMLSGPMSGYRPNVLMHGNEELSIRPMGAGISSDSSGSSEGSMRELITSVSELVDISNRQLSVNEKMLKYRQ